jgi:hypothetical protein
LDPPGDDSESRKPPRTVHIPPPEHDESAMLWAVLTLVLLVAAPILREWAEHRRRPSMQRIQELLANYEPTTDAAHIVCFGKQEVPEVGELRFEPRILSPTDIQWRRLAGVWPAALVTVWYLLAAIGLVRRPRFSFWLWAVSGAAVALAVWAWKSGVRPTYVRLAPGIVQFLAYGPGGTRPRVRSYPMSPGTLVVVQRKPRVFAFRCDKIEDTLNFESVRQRQDAEAVLWNALLSTAPIPQMSETELVG